MKKIFNLCKCDPSNEAYDKSSISQNLCLSIKKLELGI